jgi:BNR repeat-containing family member
MRQALFLMFLLISISTIFAQKQLSIKIINVGLGWANNSVNTVVFRKNALVSYKKWQFIAYYDSNSYVVLGKRKLKSKAWQLQRTPYKGNANDAHNTISIMIDGDGFLHLAFDHHNNPLRYCRSKKPLSLDMTDKMPMTGLSEQSVSYPEFHRLPNGNLLFFYRDGASGKGNLVINQYDSKTQKWTQLHRNLIDGEGRRNAYWQACIDKNGTIHISWVWRESPDVASNHDLCYARSKDGGRTWEQSTGVGYTLPLTAQNAEYACKIAQKSELINQTSMYADAGGNPYIATYWREKENTHPQYHLVFGDKNGWQTQNLGFRKTPFSLSGGGTKRIPISRPQIVIRQKGNETSAFMLFRDTERGEKVSIAFCKNSLKPEWQIEDLTTESVGSWEPTYDTELWKNKGKLHIFIQKVEQIDGEGLGRVPPQMVRVMEIDFKKR